MKFGEDPVLITLFEMLAILLSHLQTAVVGGAPDQRVAGRSYYHHVATC